MTYKHVYVCLLTVLLDSSRGWFI